MKTTFKKALFFLLYILGQSAIAQSSYNVLKVTGSVYCERLHKDLVSGDKIQSQDKLRFGGPEAYLVVISPQDGRKLVKPSTSTTTSELKSLLTDIVSLEKRHTAFRGNEDEDKQVKARKAVKTQLEVDTLLILGSGKANFSKSDFPLNDTAVIKARFRTGNSFTEKPASSGPILDLSRNSVFGSQPVTKLQLIWFPNIKGDIFDSPPESLGNFVPRYADGTALAKEVQVITGALPDRKGQALLAEIKKYIEDEYGPVLDENLVQWLAESNLLKP